METIDTGMDKVSQFNKTMTNGVANAASKEGRGKHYFDVKKSLDKALAEFEEFEEVEDEEMEEATGASSSGSYSMPLFGKMNKTNNKIPNVKSKYDLKEEKKKDEEMEEQTGASSSGAYSQPAIWAKNNKNWRAVSDKNFPKYGGPGGTFVKIKEKCKTFPYCNQGDINALEFYEGKELAESISRVSDRTGKSTMYIAKVISESMGESNLGKKLKDVATKRAKESEKKNKIKRITKEELEEIITRSFYKSPVTDPKAGIVGVTKMDSPIGKMFSMSGNKPKYEQ